MTQSNLYDVMRGEVRAEKESLIGETLTRPALLKTDGVSLTYAVDVKLLSSEERLRNIPLASGASEVRYADPGSAVTLTRDSSTGKVEVTGYSKRKPGWRHRIPVDVTSKVVGTVENVGFSVHLLTLAELATLGAGFGLTPLGAFAIYQGNTLVEVGA